MMFGAWMKKLKDLNPVNNLNLNQQFKDLNHFKSCEQFTCSRRSLGPGTFESPLWPVPYPALGGPVSPHPVSQSQFALTFQNWLSTFSEFFKPIVNTACSLKPSMVEHSHHKNGNIEHLPTYTELVHRHSLPHHWSKAFSCSTSVSINKKLPSKRGRSKPSGISKCSISCSYTQLYIHVESLSCVFTTHALRATYCNMFFSPKRTPVLVRVPNTQPPQRSWLSRHTSSPHNPAQHSWRQHSPVQSTVIVREGGHWQQYLCSIPSFLHQDHYHLSPPFDLLPWLGVLFAVGSMTHYYSSDYFF